MSSKLARQMAYKKKLEDEHREFQERCKYERKLDDESKLINDEHWSYRGNNELRRRNNFSDAEEDDIEKQKTESENLLNVEKNKRRKEEDYLKEKEKWIKKKKEYSLRASRFADLKRKRREEKRKIEEARKVLESDDLWQELDTIIRQNEKSLKQLNEYRVCVENIQKYRRDKQVVQNNPTLIEDDDKDSVQRKKELGVKAEVAEENVELQNIYARIRELEFSIVTLDDALERCDLDAMKKKTLEVKRRMTDSAGTGNIEDCLTKNTVEMFLANSSLWEKYKTS